MRGGWWSRASRAGPAGAAGGRGHPRAAHRPRQGGIVADPADAVIFLVTAASAIEGERIATALVEERLAACVNVLPGVISTFRWEGAVQREPEVLLIGKTRAERMPAVIARVQALHSYSVPEVLAVPILAGAAPSPARPPGA